MKPYSKLRGRLAETGVTQRELAIEIDRCREYVSNILNGKTDPTLSDMWKIMRSLGIDPSRMAEYFPDR